MSLTYDGNKLKMTLPTSIDAQRLMLNESDYMRGLQKRGDMPAGLRVLIAKLFQQKAITACDISYGRTMALTLSKKNPKGHELMASGKLRQFRDAFNNITGQKIAVSWAPSVPERPRGGGSTPADYSGLLDKLGRALDAVCNGIVLAAAFKELFGDDR